MSPKLPQKNIALRQKTNPTFKIQLFMIFMRMFSDFSIFFIFGVKIAFLSENRTKNRKKSNPLYNLWF